MIKVTIIGSGNVAHHLITAFLKSSDVEIIQVFSRDKQNVASLISEAKITNDYDSLLESDIYIIAVVDSAIAEVAAKLPFKDKFVVHTSGNMAMQNLDSRNKRGVFYPLQTFSKNNEVDFSNVPICLESELDDNYIILENLAEAIGSNHYLISSEQRKALHVAAVFVNNFTNHLYQIGYQICQENQLPFEVLKPLITETAQKVQNLTPADAQTGPAKRNDLSTIASHLEFLNNPLQKEIYKIITKSIQQTHVKKL